MILIKTETFSDTTAGSEICTLKHIVFWDPSEPIATRPLAISIENVGSFFYTHDLTKNVCELIDSNLEIAQTYDYAPFGAVEIGIPSGGSAIANPFQFSSEVHDSELALVYYNYRHYNPADGRFLSRDPIEEQGGLNLYAFLKNTPILHFDYLGDKVYWSAKDLENFWYIIGNHHFILIVLDSEEEAQNIIKKVSLKDKNFKKIECDKSKCKSPKWILTLSLVGKITCVNNCGEKVSVVDVEINDSSEIDAYTEFYCEKKTKGNICSRDFEGHLIDTPKDKTDLQFVIDIITAYNNFTSFPVYMRPGYDGTDRNCSTWVNVLFKTIGIPEKDRENLGEFRGIDWGEEDEDACFERMFKFRYPNSPILPNSLKIRSF